MTHVTITATDAHGVARKVIKVNEFLNRTGITAVTIPSTVTSIGKGAFRNCSALEKVDIPDGVTSIGHGAFSGCSALVTVVIPPSATHIRQSAFMYCNKLSQITMPDTVISCGENAFFYCGLLQAKAGRGLPVEEYLRSRYHRDRSRVTILLCLRQITEEVANAGGEYSEGALRQYKRRKGGCDKQLNGRLLREKLTEEGLWRHLITYL